MLAVGDKVDVYTLLERVGVGGQASVWKALDRATGGHVALKVIPLRGSSTTDERAQREARALERLSHPSLVRCHRVFELPGRRAIVLALEWVDGTTLHRARRDPRWTSLHALSALHHVASALACLHAAGVVHRDVKGSNVLVSPRFFEDPTEPCTTKLADLGLATAVGNPAPLTGLGFVVGTPPYLPPEAIDGRGRDEVRPTRDVFAFGVMGWLLERGTHPTGLPSDASVQELAEVYEDHAGAESLWLPGAPDDTPLLRAIRTCLRLSPEARPDDGAALLRLLPPLPPKRVHATLSDDTAAGVAPTMPLPSPAALHRRAAPAAPPAVKRAAPVAFAVACVVAVGLAGFVALPSLGGLVTGAEDAAAAVEPDGPSRRRTPRRRDPERPARTISVEALAPPTSSGRHGPSRSCAPHWPEPPTRRELVEHDAGRQPLDRVAFSQVDCEVEVVGSTSHCAQTHRVGRWLRLRFALPPSSRLGASWTDGPSHQPLAAEPWADGVDLYVAIPPERAVLGVEVPGLWDGRRSIVFDTEQLKTMAFAESGPCR